MELQVYKIWGQTQREWGYEIRVDLQDENGQIYNECLTYPIKPKEDEISIDIDRLKERIKLREELIREEI